MPPSSVRQNPTSLTLHHDDLDSSVQFSGAVAVDCEAMGLDIARDKLCLVQLADSEGHCHLVDFPARTANSKGGSYAPAPHLKKILEDTSLTKIFHFARFDVATLQHHLGISTTPIYCTRTASKFARTYTDKHGLRPLCKELLGIEISKQQQSSDWGSNDLNKDQLRYACRDVLHLHILRDKLDAILERENRRHLAQVCFDFLPHRVALDLAGWQDDIFAHSQSG